MKDIKKILAPAVIVLLAGIFLVKNPGIDEFEKYLIQHRISDLTEKRDANFFFFSIYSVDSKTYLGLLGWFIKI